MQRRSSEKFLERMRAKRVKAHLDDAGKHPYLSRYILPADAESYEQMVEQMVRAWTSDFAFKCSPTVVHRNRVKVMLEAIGIEEPKK